MLLNILKYLEISWNILRYLEISWNILKLFEDSIRFLIHWLSANIWRKTRLGIVTFLRFAYLIQLQIQCTPCHVADLYILRDVRSAIHSCSAVQPRRKLGSKPELHHHKNVFYDIWNHRTKSSWNKWRHVFTNQLRWVSTSLMSFQNSSLSSFSSAASSRSSTSYSSMSSCDQSRNESTHGENTLGSGNDITIRH